jgi:hypothetical protein
MFDFGIIQSDDVTIGQSGFCPFLKAGKPAKGKLQPIERFR